MNIIFCPMDGGEDQEEFVKDKLLMLHQAHPSITGAQVNFCVGKGDARLPGCEIDLTAYGQAFRIRRSGASYREAAELAVAELAEKVGRQSSGQLSA